MTMETLDRGEISADVRRTRSFSATSSNPSCRPKIKIDGVYQESSSQKVMESGNYSSSNLYANVIQPVDGDEANQRVASDPLVPQSSFENVEPLLQKMKVKKHVRSYSDCTGLSLAQTIKTQPRNPDEISQDCLVELQSGNLINTLC